MPPIARLSDCSKRSFVETSSLAAASLNAAGEDVAYSSSWATVCDETGVGAVSEVDNKSPMVGSMTLKRRTPI